MSTFSIPRDKRILTRADKSESPSFKNDGISQQKKHLPRSLVIQAIYKAAHDKQHVIIGSSAATGKTSLLQLLEKRLEEEDANVIRINMNRTGTAENLLQELEDEGISQKVKKLKEIKNTWLLLDDAQNAYDRKFDSFWHFVVKSIGSAEVDGNLFVVIAATYDLSTPESPADFRGLEHIDPNVTKKEATSLFHMHAKVWGYEKWEAFRETLVDLSKFVESETYHVGVTMAGIRMLDGMRKAKHLGLTEEEALVALRHENFTGCLDRCYRLPDDLSGNFKDGLIKVVTGQSKGIIFVDDQSLVPFIRAGLLTKGGKFSNVAATWYYNRRCFPNRAAEAPETLDELITGAVRLISARRLRDANMQGFPKEAAFQHLLNEAMSQLLPLGNAIIPELNTLVDNFPNEPSVTGELDFCVNGELQWCLELLRNGDKMGEHLARFDRNNGKYRKVNARDYIVVDCRGPKNNQRVVPSASRCTLYFAEDFKHCWCQIRENDLIQIDLAN